MKPHIKIALNDRLSDGKIPYWEDFIHDKSLIVERFNNNLDRIFERYNIRIWITKEYRSELGGFSNTAIETETGLDSVYRIIFQEDSIIPAGLTEDIRQMRIVRYAEEIEVGVASIPVTTQSALPRKYDDARASIYLPRAHLLTRGHPQIKVAILDTGLSGSHPEFEGMAIQKTDFVNLDGLDTSEFVD